MENNNFPVEAKEEPQEDFVETNFWDYLQTEKGHNIADKIVTIFADLKNTATSTISKERDERLKAEIGYKKFQQIVQISVFAIAAIVVSSLSFLGKLDPGVSMLMGTMVGYFFGRNKNQS